MVSLDHFIDLSAQNAIKFKSFITTIIVVSSFVSVKDKCACKRAVIFKDHSLTLKADN